MRAGVERGDTAVTVQYRPTWCMCAFRLSPPPPLVLPCSGDPESLLPLCWSEGASDTTNTHAKYQVGEMWNYVAALNTTHLLLVPCLLYVALKELVLQEGKQRFGLISLQTHTHSTA